ncbi:hypothetical protein KDK82_1755 [Delftia sp. K82]|uniref:hypothetical protein n=1 Tax=Delftia sp. K82 TaxID=1472718 RepID=UPI000B6AD33E|nr:hypothetical protein [Delftia sp. K82]OWG18276.1 hypothetical protein KDK82_1755 [Delftia sp. K82]
MTAIQRFALHGTIMNPHSSGPYVRHEDHLAAMQGRCLAQIEEPAGAAPAAVAPQGEYPHEQMDAMALARYKVVPSHASMLWSHAVVAGHGAQQLYVGREVECQNMARKFAGAFLDGAFAFHSMAAAPTAQAAPALEAPAAPAVPPGFALVPLRLTRAMDEAISEEGWQWEDLLAAAQAVTEEQYEASAQDRLSQDEVRAIFLDCGFVIKEGQTDLKPYVYEAAQLLESRVRAIAAAAPQAPAAPSDAQLLSEWDRVSGITKATERRLACMRSVLQRWGSAAPAAPAVDASDVELLDFLQQTATAVELLAQDEGEPPRFLVNRAISKDVRSAIRMARGKALAAQAKECGSPVAAAPIDGCTDPYNCARCKTHPAHRGDMHHAGISRIGGSA